MGTTGAVAVEMIMVNKASLAEKLTSQGVPVEISIAI